MTQNPLTASTATELAAAIARRELKSREVVEAHIERIEATHEVLNAVVMPLFDEARAAADEADRALQQNEPLGPLHGVPVTIKDMLDVAGTPTVVGLLPRAAEKAQEDAIPVAQLRRAGAILLGKTNVPQMGLMIETDNPVFGRTNNPWSADRSPGGSSGGEAAIIAAGGSPLGLGSDGGGSIRLPAHFSGICGLKPTSQRLSMRGHWKFPAFPAGFAQPGPLARSVADLDRMLQVLCTDQPDPYVFPVPLRSYHDVELASLRVGFYLEDGALAAAPAVRRAVEESCQALSDLGATVQAFEPPAVDEAWGIFFALTYADGGFFARQVLCGSKLDWRIRQNYLVTKMPRPVRPLIRRLLQLAGQPRVAQSIGFVKHNALWASEFQEVTERMNTYRNRFMDALQAQEIDALICPPTLGPAVLHQKPYAAFGARSTMVFNLLGLPAGVVPATTVRSGEECDRAPSREVVLHSQAEIEADSTGLPVGVQVAARHWREDVALAIMSALERHFRAQPGFPQTPVDPL